MLCRHVKAAWTPIISGWFSRLVTARRRYSRSDYDDAFDVPHEVVEDAAPSPAPVLPSEFSIRPMPRQSRLVVGLGNPGPRYASNRHNVGFRAIEAYMSHADDRHQTFWSESYRKTFEEFVGTDLHGYESVTLVKPLQGMNLSGAALGSYLAQLQQARARSELIRSMLVICDDLSLPFGAMKLRMQGGSGGQNGLQNIINSFGHKIARLRIGIGPQGMDDAQRRAHWKKNSVVKHVLSDFTPSEEGMLEGEVLPRVCDVIDRWLTADPMLVMNEVNRGD